MAATIRRFGVRAQSKASSLLRGGASSDEELRLLISEYRVLVRTMATCVEARRQGEGGL